jgi:hypothetical protein
MGLDPSAWRSPAETENNSPNRPAARRLMRNQGALPSGSNGAPVLRNLSINGSRTSILGSTHRLSQR